MENQNGKSTHCGRLGTLAMIVAGIAQGKGRSGLNWFLLSLAFGPLALFFLITMDPIKK
jgi:hypothetical protein